MNLVVYGAYDTRDITADEECTEPQTKKSNRSQMNFVNRRFDPSAFENETRRFIQSQETKDALADLDKLRNDPRFKVANHFLFVLKILAVVLSAVVATYYFFRYKPVLEDPKSKPEERQNVMRKWTLMFGSMGFFPMIQGTILSLIVIICFKLFFSLLPMLIEKFKASTIAQRYVGM